MNYLLNSEIFDISQFKISRTIKPIFSVLIDMTTRKFFT